MHMQHLSLYGSPLTGAALSHLAQMTRLQVLRCGKWIGFSEENMQVFRQFKELIRLDLFACNLKGSSLGALAFLEKLQSLDLSHNPESQSISFVAGMNVRELNLSYCTAIKGKALEICGTRAL